MFDVPYVRAAIPKSGGTETKWIAYKKNLRFREKADKSFRSGVTDVLKLYGDGVDAENVTKLVREERKKNPEAADAGTPEQVKARGKGSDEAPFTKDD